MRALNILIKWSIICTFIAASAKAFGQACPACSNPALQSSEKLEAGLDSLKKGAFRLTLNVTNGYDYQGGHPAYNQLTPDGHVHKGQLHEHIVDLDFLRNEISMEYTFKTNWTLWLRIPYDIKSQTADIIYHSDFTDYEKENILRNRDIHHRNETYRGFSDFRLFVVRRINSFLSKNGRLDLALGASLPIGKIEDDPLLAGTTGKKHMHIQFGSGTVDPLLELHYTNSFAKNWSLALFTMNKVSLYENNRTYRGPFETTSGFSLGYRVKKWLALRSTVANFSQSQAKWNGLEDPNSGLLSFNGTVAPTFTLDNGLSITPGYRFPIYQRTLSSEGDVFEYGPTFIINISYLWNR